MQRTFKVASAVKAIAREKIGAPPPTRFKPSGKRKQPRYKETIGKLLAEYR